jgi:hypothetical protein
MVASGPDSGNLRSRPPAAGGIGLYSAIAIGIGGMVGAGIFSILGVVAQAAGNGMWISFLIVLGVLSCYIYQNSMPALITMIGLLPFCLPWSGLIESRPEGPSRRESYKEARDSSLARIHQQTTK